MSDNIFCALAWDQVPIIPEASSCVQSLFTSFAVVSVIKNFTPFCINRFQNTFCHSYRGKFHLLFFSLSCLLPVDFCFYMHVGTCWPTQSPVSWGGGKRRNGRHHPSQEELSMLTVLSPWWESQHSQIILVLRLLGASLQLLKSQLETQCSTTAFLWGARSPAGLAG